MVSFLTNDTWQPPVLIDSYIDCAVGENEGEQMWEEVCVGDYSNEKQISFHPRGWGGHFSPNLCWPYHTNYERALFPSHRFYSGHLSTKQLKKTMTIVHRSAPLPPPPSISSSLPSSTPSSSSTSSPPAPAHQNPSPLEGGGEGVGKEREGMGGGSSIDRILELVKRGGGEGGGAGGFIGEVFGWNYTVSHHLKSLEVGRMMETQIFSVIELILTIETYGSLIFQEGIRSVLILSDFFDQSRMEWMLAKFVNFVEQEQTKEEGTVNSMLVLGVLKAVSVLSCIPRHDSLVDTIIQQISASAGTGVTGLLRSSLESSQKSIQIATLNGILYLLDASVHKVLTSNLEFLFKYLLNTLTNQPSLHLPLTLHALSVAFLLIEKYPKNCEQSDFTRQVVERAIILGRCSDAPLGVVECVLGGFNRLLMCCVLSQSLRNYILSFGVEKLTEEKSHQFLLSLNIMVTCFYTGGVTKGVESHILTSKGLAVLSDKSHMDDAEKMKILLRKMRKSEPLEAHASCYLLPQLLYEFFTVDEGMSLLLQEFVRIRRHKTPRYLATSIGLYLHLLQTYDETTKTAKEINEKGAIKWLVVCLKNFTQLQPSEVGRWCVAVLLISFSRNPALRQLTPSLLHSYPQVEKDVLVCGFIDFYTHPCTISSRQEVLDALTDLPDLDALHQALVVEEKNAKKMNETNPSPRDQPPKPPTRKNIFFG
uniref:Uncharacterized protein n=1 Tax=Paramoeba aestuarina TaxID=180227 RepID=A0A7S4KIS8_9EUKA|mmetsp:Transcript_19822/g.31048  ORF Transcript_19822/g.31048 Transcript_19822/m.31048 type:complete len:706 (+) Transcript_19822:181-2298(+)